MQKIKLSLDEIVKSLGSLNSINKKEGQDFKFNYRIAKISKKLEPILKPYLETTAKFYKENGKFNVNESKYKLESRETIEGFNAINKELLAEEFEIEVQKIPIKMFEAYDITGDEIRSLFWLIDGEL